MLDNVKQTNKDLKTSRHKSLKQVASIGDKIEL